jgi:DNA-nicking Smr family endonuclease
MARRKKRKKDRNAKPKTRAGVFNPALWGRIDFPGELTSGSPDRSKDLGLIDSGLDEDERLFHEAMADVAPLGDEPNRFVTLPNTDRRPAHPAPDDELETLARLTDLVSGSAVLDITFSDEFIEGTVQGLDPGLMRRLKRGEFPLQNYIDLHGLTRQEAQEKVTDFILESYRAGLRCVLVVHGRGHNSENHLPILKERLPHWLTRGPARKIVLAFSTARPYDGGTGALYILLRKRRGAL